jgi:hypothetical protein
VKIIQTYAMVILCFVQLISCSPEGKKTSGDHAYWSVQEKLEDTWKRLEDSGVMMKRQMFLGDEVLADTVPEPAWREEMRLFKSINISPVDWKGGYRINVGTHSFDEENLLKRWSFQAVDENMELRTLTANLDENGHLRRLDAFLYERNLFRKNGKRLWYDVQKGYRVEIQDTLLFFGDPSTTKIEVLFERKK